MKNDLYNGEYFIQKIKLMGVGVMPVAAKANYCSAPGPKATILPLAFVYSDEVWSWIEYRSPAIGSKRLD